MGTIFGDRQMNPDFNKQQGQAPQQGQPVAYQQQGQPVTYQQQPQITHVAVGNIFREVPQQCTCQFCNSTIATGTRTVVGTFTWLAAGVTFLVGCVAGCCLIPFCLDSCKDVEHTCPSCGRI